MVRSVYPMSAVGAGDEVRIRSFLSGDLSQTQRLRELGVLEGRTLRIVTNHDPLICQVGECRFGVCRRLARCVMVERVA